MSAGEQLWIEGLDRPVMVRRTARARRVTLTVNHASQVASVTAPPRVSEAQLIAFVENNRAWLAERLSALPEAKPFVFGMMLPFRGEARRVERAGKTGLSTDGSVLGVKAEDWALPGALERWLKAQARKRLTECSAVHAAALDVNYSRISIRDTRSRWGSCSSKGALSYSWRAILAPDGALDYLAAHEVSHLREMNHSPRFWAHVAALCPEHMIWRRWFKDNGADLHRYGLDDAAGD